MKESIASCTRHNHSLPSADFTPERLVDVRGDTPKLVERNNVIASCSSDPQSQLQTPRFTALSYCWGTPDEAKGQLTTTASSLTQRLTGIEDHEITPVLRDAIHITKLLSIPYLWIDSLCIRQDDTTDWERQCVDMDKIYGHAEVTIVAASSGSCHEGFLRRIEGHQIRVPFHSTRDPSLSGSVLIHLKGVERGDIWPPPDIFRSDALKCRLAKRGWAIQEQILSTRRIIFGVNNVHFICPELCHSRGKPPSQRKYDTTIHEVKAVRNNQELYDKWGDILKSFSQIDEESFTHATDLLPSLSGLASLFAGLLQDEYYAGHWGKDLATSLAWKIGLIPRDAKSVHLDRISSPDPFLVPSWSQLCKPYPVNLVDYYPASWPPVSEFEHIDAKVSLCGSNPFGAIKRAWLQVRSHTMTLKSATGIELVETPLLYHRLTPLASCRLSIKGTDGGISYCHVWPDYDMSEKEAHEEALAWKWILLGSCSMTTRKTSIATEGREDRQPYGLLLHRVNISEWCRVGMFFAMPYGCSHAMFSLQAFKNASEIETVTII
ncbi:uncharacterized protein JN550_007292 [Neoarthrinium moseri]|uniref:uncharacterized protein n=1 Tax=Neoarthrinium moseri TaxID=1658444 RepID=UPI001FDAED53|nr:uncharacterized protein JN550_007292 [Neoarthrinium moseri]KAI1867240.1 hypothetical protein JN550_007292 [Neoarthrinium moseri]